MSTIKIPNKAWRKLYPFLKQHPDIYAGNEQECKRFIEGILWVMRSGAQWRELPEKFGNWNSVYKRFSRWEERGIWEQMHLHFAEDADMEYGIIDSTVTRAHPCASGGSKKNGSQEKQGLGRSRGGFSTKIHTVVDGLGNPLRYIITGGQRHDITEAKNLLAGHEFEHVLADKAYDSDDFLKVIAEQDAIAVIPPTKKRKEKREYDKHIYKERHLVECFINKIKWYRRIFSRFDKLACRYLAFLHFAGVLIWLR